MKMHDELASGLATAAIILALCLGVGTCSLMADIGAAKRVEAAAQR